MSFVALGNIGSKLANRSPGPGRLSGGYPGVGREGRGRKIKEDPMNRDPRLPVSWPYVLVTADCPWRRIAMAQEGLPCENPSSATEKTSPFLSRVSISFNSSSSRAARRHRASDRASPCSTKLWPPISIANPPIVSVAKMIPVVSRLAAANNRRACSESRLTTSLSSALSRRVGPIGDDLDVPAVPDVAVDTGRGSLSMMVCASWRRNFSRNCELPTRRSQLILALCTSPGTPAPPCIVGRQLNLVEPGPGKNRSLRVASRQVRPNLLDRAAHISSCRRSYPRPNMATKRSAESNNCLLTMACPRSPMAGDACVSHKTGSRTVTAISAVNGIPLLNHRLGNPPLYRDISRRGDHYREGSCCVRHSSSIGVPKSVHFAPRRKVPRTPANTWRKCRSCEQDFETLDGQRIAADTASSRALASPVVIAVSDHRQYHQSRGRRGTWRI